MAVAVRVSVEAGHGLFLFLCFSRTTETVLDVIVDDEIQLMSGQFVLRRERSVDFIENVFSPRRIHLIVLYLVALFRSDGLSSR